MLNQTCPVLETKSGVAVPLLGMSIKTKIEDLFTTTSVEQRYENQENTNIEAVYTFPLPIDAVLMQLLVQIGERTLAAKIMEKSQAEETYEEAITDGDTVVMLQQLESGMYTMNVGNLMPSEKISIKLIYSYTQRWQGSQCRLFIPTTIAPRYGEPVGMQAHQTPDTSVFVEHRTDFSVEISGMLAKATLSSPSHSINVIDREGRIFVNLQKETELMDRDFILNIESDADHNFGLYTKDDEGYVALASFHPLFPQLEANQPKNFKIVVDCSGSMGGSSIDQARIAVKRIIESLSAGDFFNIVLFGSSNHSLFTQMVPAIPGNIEQALKLADGIDANLGGTEIGAALQTTYALKSEANLKNDVLLITDGEVWGHEDIVRVAMKSGHRVFTVGVGNSVSEEFVRELATKTGGACELVSPNEDMAERILRHFKRMRAPAAEKVEMQWSNRPIRQLEIGPVYNGDTVNVYAWFKQQPDNKASLLLYMHDGSVLKQDIELHPAADIADEEVSELARLAAAKRINELEDKEQIVRIACDYQLMSRHTNYIMVDVRADGDKAEDLPELRKVPNMLAEGWGGMGAPTVDKMSTKLKRVRGKPSPAPVAASASDSFMDAVGNVFSDVFSSRSKKESSVPKFDEALCDLDIDYDEEASGITPQNANLSAKEFALEFSRLYPTLGSAELKMELLIKLKLDTALIFALQSLIAKGHGEQQVIVAFLDHLYTEYGDQIDRDFKRGLRKLFKQSNVAEELQNEVNALKLAA